MRLVLAIAGLALVLGGCGLLEGGDVDDALGDVRERADELIARGQAELADTFEWCAGAANLAKAVFDGDVEAARTAADELRATAPADLGADLRTVAEAAARAQVGDPRQLADEEVHDAARNVYAHAAEVCGIGDGGEG